MSDLEQRLRDWAQSPPAASIELDYYRKALFEAADTLAAVREIADRFDGYNGDDMAVEGRWRKNDRLEHFASLRREKEEAQREGLRLVGLLRERDDTLAAIREVLEYIAHFDDAHMETARTLHYDMRGKAREALEALNRGDTDE